MAGKLEHKDEAVMKRLLVFDTLRGLDATGIAAVRSKTYEVVIAKAASNPFELFETGRFKKALSAWDSSVFIGHNRSATTGAKTSLNAHPFEFGSVVGAHNGTLTSKSWKDIEAKISEDFDVDSQALICAIDRLGLKDTIEMTEKGATAQTGAWSITYYDAKDDSLNFIRNKWRPMWVCYTKEFDRVFWASEWPMLHAALAMDDRIKDLYRDENGNCFFSLPEDTWFKADIGILLAGGKECPLKAVMEVKGKEVTYNYNPPFMGASHAGTTTTSSGSRNSSGNVTTLPTGTRKSHIFSVSSPKNDPFFDILDSQELIETTHQGCVWCGDAIDGSEQGSTYVELVDGIICPKCTGQTSTSRAILKNDTFDTMYELMVE
jgi:predicted glutamine amidotransferase